MSFYYVKSYITQKRKEVVLMASLLKRIVDRLANSKLNANFNREVSKKCEVTEEDKQNYALVHEAFQEYKKNK